MQNIMYGLSLVFISTGMMFGGDSIMLGGWLGLFFAIFGLTLEASEQLKASKKQPKT